MDQQEPPVPVEGGTITTTGLAKSGLATGGLAKRGLIDRYGLWTDLQRSAAHEILRRIEAEGIELVRFSFADQHGLLRGKTLLAGEVASTFRSGCAVPSTLIAKDTAHRTAVPTFRGDQGLGVAGVGGAGDIVMVPDPTTFRVLPWAPNTGWILCNLHETGGDPQAFCTRQLLRGALDRLADHGYGLTAGLEVEFHIFRLLDARLKPELATQPGAAPEVALLSHGFQYLTETRLDEIDDVVQLLARTIRGLDLPIRSIEGEMGPSQFEVTFKPVDAMEAADAMALFRSAVKQVCRRAGLHATFMCRPQLANAQASGWHLHQSVRDLATGENVLAPDVEGQLLSPLGLAMVAGLLESAAASCVFSTPTINGYKRYRSYSMAPDRAIWGRDNKGAMLRIVNTGPGDPATRIENRVGEPAANPYLYMASQVHSALYGIKHDLRPTIPSDTPYDTDAPLLPKSLIEAVEALRRSELYRESFGPAFVNYIVTIKQAEISRFLSEVTDWEQREYFDMF